MKIFGFLLMVLTALDLPGQNVRSILESIQRSDRAQMEIAFTENVSLNLMGQRITKPTAVIQALERFVSTYQIKICKPVHEIGNKSEEDQMGIGTIYTDKGKYRVYLNFTHHLGKISVSEIKIEKDEL